MPTLTEALNNGLQLIRNDKSIASVVVTGVAGSGLVYTFEIYRDETIRQISAVAP